MSASRLRLVSRTFMGAPFTGHAIRDGAFAVPDARTCSAPVILPGSSGLSINPRSTSRSAAPSRPASAQVSALRARVFQASGSVRFQWEVKVSSST